MQNPRSTFDRKHYFYHDIPTSYQITQHYSLSTLLMPRIWVDDTDPLARDGTLQIYKGENGTTRDLTVNIQQLQVEQDTAKSQLVGTDRLIDLNRAGAGLMEIVTDPDMRYVHFPLALRRGLPLGSRSWQIAGRSRGICEEITGATKEDRIGRWGHGKGMSLVNTH